MNTRTNHLAASDLLVDDTELETHVITPIPRIVDMFARRLQVPERMTSQIADFIDETLKPQGVAVVLGGMRLCGMMRGVKRANARMVTSTMLGAFRTNQAARNEFMQPINRQLNQEF